MDSIEREKDKAFDIKILSFYFLMVFDNLFNIDIQIILLKNITSLVLGYLASPLHLMEITNNFKTANY